MKSLALVLGADPGLAGLSRVLARHGPGERRSADVK
jgi:hypothetical protein